MGAVRRVTLTLDQAVHLDVSDTAAAVGVVTVYLQTTCTMLLRFVVAGDNNS
jgi:hypothetical protein